MGAFGHFQRDPSPTTLWLPRMQSTKNMSVLGTGSIEVTYSTSEGGGSDVVTPASAIINWDNGGTDDWNLQNFLSYSGDMGTGIEP
jgi:hypothetical protein